LLGGNVGNGGERCNTKIPFDLTRSPGICKFSVTRNPPSPRVSPQPIKKEQISKIRILVCDDHPMMIRGVCEYLSLQPNFEIIGTVSSGEEAVRVATERKPDVLVIDISLPDITGIEATKRILVKMPDARVVILTMHEDEEHARQFVQSGALGYVLKKNSPDEIVQAVNSVIKGMVFCSPQVQSLILREHRNIQPTDNDGLTTREIDVLKLVATGFTSKEIGDKLNIADSTATMHRKNIMNKLDLHSIAELTAYAIRKGLIPRPT